MELTINSEEFKAINEEYNRRNRKLLDDIDSFERETLKMYDDLEKVLIKRREERERLKDKEEAERLEKIEMQHR